MRKFFRYTAMTTALMCFTRLPACITETFGPKGDHDYQSFCAYCIIALVNIVIFYDCLEETIKEIKGK